MWKFRRDCLKLFAMMLAVLLVSPSFALAKDKTKPTLSSFSVSDSCPCQTVS